MVHHNVIAVIAKRIPGEAWHKLVCRDLLAFLSKSHKGGKKPNNLARRKASVANNAKVKVVVALGEPPSVRVYKKRDVRVGGRSKAKQSLQVDLPWRGPKEVVATYHLLRTRKSPHSRASISEQRP